MTRLERIGQNLWAIRPDVKIQEVSLDRSELVRMLAEEMRDRMAEGDTDIPILDMTPVEALARTYAIFHFSIGIRQGGSVRYVPVQIGPVQMRP